MKQLNKLPFLINVGGFFMKSSECVTQNDTMTNDKMMIHKSSPIEMYFSLQTKSLNVFTLSPSIRHIWGVVNDCTSVLVRVNSFAIYQSPFSHLKIIYNLITAKSLILLMQCVCSSSLLSRCCLLPSVSSLHASCSPATLVISQPFLFKSFFFLFVQHSANVSATNVSTVSTPSHSCWSIYGLFFYIHEHIFVFNLIQAKTNKPMTTYNISSQKDKTTVGQKEVRKKANK